MSRFSDDYDEDYNNQGALWWANANRALNGRKGRAALAELETALLELPEKKLISGRLAENGQVCAVGALVAKRRVEAGEPREAVLAKLERLIDEDGYGGVDVTATCATTIGLTYMLGYRLAYANDEDVGWKATPEQRYDAVLAWVRKKLNEAPAPSKAKAS